MGFGSVLGTFMLFGVFFLGLTAIFVSYQDHIYEKARTTTEDLTGNIVAQKSGDLNLTNLYNVTENLSAIIKNIGSSRIGLSEIDFYLNGRIIPRENSIRVMHIGNDIKNPGIWDPGERLFVNFTTRAVENTTLLITSLSGARANGTYPLNSSIASSISEIVEELHFENGTNYSSSTFSAYFALGDISALNVADGTTRVLTKPASGISRFNMTLADTSFPPLAISNATLYLTYFTSAGGFTTVDIQILDGSIGPILCIGTLASSAATITVPLDCTGAVTPANINNIWVHLNNTFVGGATRDYTFDFVRMNVTYTYSS